MSSVYIKKVISKSNIVNIKNDPFETITYEIINYDTNDYNYKLDVNPILAKKLYNAIVSIKSIVDENIYKRNTEKSNKRLKAGIQREVKKTADNAGLL